MKLAFTSCSHPRKHPSQPGWLALMAHEPDVLVLLGDNIYLENHWWNVWLAKPVQRLTQAGFARHLHDRYRMQWQVPQFQALLRRLQQNNAQVLGTVDDHDFLGNDLCVSDGTQTQAKIARVLHRQFIASCNAPLPTVYPSLPDWLEAPDPGFSEGLGLASHRVVGDVSLTVLDNRSYRQKSGKSVPDAPVLGQRQLDWLCTRLQGSQPLQLVFSGSPLTDGTRRLARGSPLQDHPAEYGQLCALYRAQGSRCIVHVGGDLHYNDFKHKDSENPCINLTSSGMGSGWQPFAARPNGNYGLIEWNAGQLRIRTFGNEARRNVDVRLAPAC